MALVTTPGASNAQSYATFAEFQTYWNSRLYNTVPLATDQQTVEVALQWAAQLLDALFNWTGMATLTTQNMAWPRVGMLTTNNYPLDSMTVPQRLKDAQSEFAGLLLSTDRSADNPDLKAVGEQVQLTSIKAGSVALSFAGKSFSTLENFDAFVRSINSDLNYLSKVVPDSVRMKLAPSWFIQASLKRKMIFGAL